MSDPVTQVRQICLALPEAQEKSFGGHTSPAFRVRDKLFVMVSEDQTSMTFKEGFYVPPYVGSKGGVGVRLDIGHDGAELAELLRDSYRLIAPRRLAAQI